MKTTIKQSGTDREGRAKWEAQRAKDKHNIISVLAVVVMCLLVALACLLLAKPVEPAEAAMGADLQQMFPSEPAEITYYFDVPLSAEVQDCIFACCEQYGLWPELVLAVIEVESSYNANAYNGSCYGLMQIHEVNHPRLMDELGITDFYEPKDNIQAGCYMLSELLAKYGEVHAALMAYNCGERKAAELWDSGVYTTEYTRKVVEIMKKLEE